MRYSPRPSGNAVRVTETVMRALHRFTPIVLLCVAACGKGSKSAAPAAPPGAARPSMPAGPAEYTVIVKSTWTKVSHPFEYPSDAHFSGMIGASHNAKYSIFAIGRRPTPGLERLSEEGKHSPLDTEIRAAIDQGNALMLFESGGLKNWKDSMVATVRRVIQAPFSARLISDAPVNQSGLGGVGDQPRRERCLDHAAHGDALRLRLGR